MRLLKYERTIRMGTLKGFWNGFDSFIKKFLYFLVIAIFVFSIVSVPICMAVYMKGYSDIFSVKELVWFFSAIIYLAVVFLLGKLLQNKKDIVLIFSMLLIEAGYVTYLFLFYDTQPCSDYRDIWNAAVEMSRGTFTDGLKGGSYMYMYNWQLGIAAFESFFVKIFGENFFALKVFSAIVTAINNFLVYKCCCIKFNRKVGVYAYVIATMFIPWMLSVPQFTNHHIGFTLLLLALLLIDKDKWYTYMAAGILIGLWNVLRPMGVILVIAAFCMAVYNMINKHSRNAVISNLSKFAALFLTFAVVVVSFNVLFIKREYTDINLSSSRIPYFKLQKGLYGYNFPFGDYNKFGDIALYNEAMKQELTEKVKTNPVGICTFVAEKMVRYCGMLDYQFEMTFDHNSEVWTQYPIKAFYSTSWFYYAFALIIAVIAFIKKRKENNVDIFMVFFIGNTLVYLFIEAFSSYRFESYIFIIMFMAVGFAMIDEKISNKKKLEVI